MEIHIGHLIKKEMINQGMNPTELAERIYVSRPNIYSIFTRKSIDAELLDRICEALQINLFEVLARELEARLGDKTPKEMLDHKGLISIITYGDDRDIVCIDDNNQPYFIEEQLGISLMINGAGFFDETIDLPTNMFPKLLQSYARAIAGPLKGCNDDEIGQQFFPWLEKKCPRQAACIKFAVEKLLLERISGPDGKQYKEALNYEAPTSIDDTFHLLNNNIEYWLDGLPQRIRIQKTLLLAPNK